MSNFVSHYLCGDTFLSTNPDDVTMTHHQFTKEDPNGRHETGELQKKKGGGVNNQVESRKSMAKKTKISSNQDGTRKRSS